jgi:hypothetical protein
MLVLSLVVGSLSSGVPNLSLPLQARLRLSAPTVAEAPSSDQNEGTLTPREVSAGLGGALLGQVSSAGLSFAMDQVFTDRSTDSIRPTPLIYLGIVTEVVATPLLVVALERLVVARPFAGSVALAIRNAYLVRLGEAPLVFAALTWALISGIPPVAAVVLVGLWALSDLVAMPIAVGYGLHQGDTTAEAIPAESSPPPPPYGQPPPQALLELRY